MNCVKFTNPAVVSLVGDTCDGISRPAHVASLDHFRLDLAAKSKVMVDFVYGNLILIFYNK